MPISQVDIVNKALIYLGISEGISSMSESTTKAQAATLIYDSTLNEVLREHAWGFANVIETLAQISDEMPTGGGWEYLYAYPSKCVQVRKVHEETALTDPDGVEFEEMLSPTTGTRAIAANISPAYARYTYQVTDPNGFDPKFIEAFSLKLATILAPTLTGTPRNDLLNSYVLSISEAKRQNLNERKVDTTSTDVSSYISARG
jgi:hypothetical protein